MRLETRALWLAAAASLGAAALLFAAHAANDRLISETAARISDPRTAAPESSFVRDIRFASSRLRDPALADLHPAWVRWYYRWNPLHPGPADVLRWGSDYRGPCGSHANVAVALLGAHHVPARVLLIRDDHQHVIHTVVEANLGGRWVVADPAFGIIYRERDGRLASAGELAADTALFRRQTRGVPGYSPDYDYDSVTLLNWRKDPVVFPAVKAGLDVALGRERADRIAKPSLWLHPRASLGALCLTAAGVFASLALLTSRRDG